MMYNKLQNTKQNLKKKSSVEGTAMSAGAKVKVKDIILTIIHGR